MAKLDINFKNILINEDKYIYPDNTRPPEWVITKLEEFVKRTNNISKSDKTLGEKNKENIIVIKDILFNKPNIKIKGLIFPFSKKNKNITLVVNTLSEMYDDKDFMWYYFIFYYMGFYYSMLKPSAFTPDSLILPKEFQKKKKDLINDLKSKKIDEIVFQKRNNELTLEVIEHLNKKNVPLMDFINSGAKGDVKNIQEILVGVGLSINSKGDIIDIIDNSLSEGLTQTQFFNNSSQAIQTLYAKSSDTRKPGYLGRKLETVIENIKLSKDRDCGSKDFLIIEIKNRDMLEAFNQRYYYDNKLKLIDKNNEKLIGKKLNIRSPLFCKSSDGICNVCYDQKLIKDLELVRGSNIGLISSTGILGELVNLTLKGSHTGISLNQEEIDFVKDLDENM